MARTLLEVAPARLTRSALRLATSASGLGSPCHIYTGKGLPPPHPHRDWTRRSTSAPGLDSSYRSASAYQRSPALQPGEADEIAEDILEETTAAEADEDALVEWCLCVDRGHALQLQKRPCCGTPLSTASTKFAALQKFPTAVVLYLVWNRRFDVQAVGR